MTKRAMAFASAMALALAIHGGATAQQRPITVGEKEYYRAPAAQMLVFANRPDLFADAKIAGIEIIQQERRIATNGDVRLSATPGQWDPAARVVDRRVDRATGVIEVDLEYPDRDFRYTVRTEPAGPSSVRVSVVLPAALPATLAGKAGFTLEFLPSAYFHQGYLADGRPGIFPLHPSPTMERTDTRNPASGRSDGPGAEPLPMAEGQMFVLSPSDPATRVTVRANGGQIGLYDGRAQAQNGWFVLRGLLPEGRTGRVLDWTVEMTSVPGWTRAPVIGHSQLGYTPGEAKVATIELDAADRAAGSARLIRIGADGRESVAAQGAPERWGDYLRYRYHRFDFSKVREPGLYLLEYGKTRTAPFRIADDIYADAWHPSLGVFLPVQMDHMFVNEAYRVWHGDPHRDDARQAPVNHEHIDLYRQGPTTDTRFEPGEHIPGLNMGGWLDAGDFDIRTQTQYAVVRSLVRSHEQFGIARDTTSVDWTNRRVEIHVPDGSPDILQQIRHGALQLQAQFDAVGHAIHGIVEPDVGQYTHLGDASTKTDGLVFDADLKPYEVKGGRSGTPDDRWAFTSKASALNYGSIAALAAASRAMKGYDDAFAARALETAQRVWADEDGRAPDTFRHGNTTGGPIEVERFAAAVELLQATRDQRYARAIEDLVPKLGDRLAGDMVTALDALPLMPASYRTALEQQARAWATRAAGFAKANPYGVPIGEGGWAGNGGVIAFGLTAYRLHKAFPDIVPARHVFDALAYIHGNHPGSDISFVSGVGTRSKEVAYGSNRADFSYIAGGVVPGALIVKPDFPENKEDWPFFWGENEYVVDLGADYIELANAADTLSKGR
ncbi:glycoside hydrolase family 9 protein [Sphingomonas sp.]|uniref:glycoside hydrolase family 9 protein n=1 Tax=Sphingomonas sp. TaxID=28214 RepID=UPI002BE84427|nr:glycoside hydrolase family 9 protein [Sphingomonas sp.]HTG38153.1 glycoside hydrolase family 9 protein [Sphingomonas sp.]